jgi:hypothetical protein
MTQVAPFILKTLRILIPRGKPLGGSRAAPHRH